MGSRPEAGGGVLSTTGLALVWTVAGLELRWEGGLAAGVWVGAFWGVLVAGSGEDAVAVAVSTAIGGTMAVLVAARAAAREELGGEAEAAAWVLAGDTGVAVCPRVLLVGDLLLGVACGGAVSTGCFLELRLLRGGVELRWAGVSAGGSTSIEEASVGRFMDAAAA